MTRDQWNTLEPIITENPTKAFALGWLEVKTTNVTPEQVVELMELYGEIASRLDAPRCSVADRRMAAQAIDHLLGSFLKYISVAEQTADELIAAQTELAQTA